MLVFQLFVLLEKSVDGFGVLVFISCCVVDVVIIYFQIVEFIKVLVFMVGDCMVEVCWVVGFEDVYLVQLDVCGFCWLILVYYDQLCGLVLYFVVKDCSGDFVGCLVVSGVVCKMYFVYWMVLVVILLLDVVDWLFFDGYDGVFVYFG